MNEDSRLRSLGQDGEGIAAHLAGHLLLQPPRVMVTPHCAFFTREAPKGWPLRGSTVVME